MVYRLSPEEYDSRIRLEVNPKPSKTVRTPHVIVRLNDISDESPP
ncbi:MAG: hypothetical protein V1875_03645 [Candidatus Altiarchaeota archaeon]